MKNDEKKIVSVELNDETLTSVTGGVAVEIKGTPEILPVAPGVSVDGKDVKTAITVGDNVLISKYSGTEVKR